ncbi:MAG: dihydroxyacetone kinase subunit L [Geminicoccaceae bacterium]|nr:MAG: dihydroxyacetone kinase subunit L [Geminicoccaceae bacterium]
MAGEVDPAGFDRAVLAMGLARIARHMEVVADELNALDGQLGDGDLGVTMVRGSRAVAPALDDLPPDLGKALMTVAQGFTKSSGSSFGTLVATGLLAAAKELKGRERADWSEVSGLLRAAFKMMRTRGKAELGDKTVLDTLDAAATATVGCDSGPAVLDAARRAVEDTMDRMRDAPAKIGRARIFGEKSVGLDDPGMLAFRRILDGLAEG